MPDSEDYTALSASHPTIRHGTGPSASDQQMNTAM
eukprot:CAMPEP_0170136144 /NCGR_PEP_ID=MMETSP0033_2-20121228/3043_1 /TAXON_ID=195969 /ORGANISM="Dolichomastix tenuilepis, Strain CCMP3274" /LENGTH=34 /DNA_ID= /DNA_START= /DNA_END= /DNA_ORIENTATION=